MIKKVRMNVFLILLASLCMVFALIPSLATSKKVVKAAGNEITSVSITMADLSDFLTTSNTIGQANELVNETNFKVGSPDYSILFSWGGNRLGLRPLDGTHPDWTNDSYLRKGVTYYWNIQIEPISGYIFSSTCEVKVNGSKDIFNVANFEERMALVIEASAIKDGAVPVAKKPTISSTFVDATYELGATAISLKVEATSVFILPVV